MTKIEITKVRNGYIVHHSVYQDYVPSAGSSSSTYVFTTLEEAEAKVAELMKQL